MNENPILPPGHLAYRRSAIESESPELYGYENIDYNLSESSVSDAVLDPLDVHLKDLVLWYGDHLGKPELRALIAAEAPGVAPDDVMLATGAAAALFIINTSLLANGDHALVLHPNYVTNIETPRAIGAEVEFIHLEFEQDWRLDLDELANHIRPTTRLVSLTSPHNPTGMVIPEEDLRAVIRLVEEKGCYLLYDETYREMTRGKTPPLAASLSPRAISVASLSKSYGLPGIRMGWLVNRDPVLMERFLAAKEQIFICGSVLDEEVAYQYLSKKDTYLPAIWGHIHTNFQVLQDWMAESRYMEWVEPQGGVVSFPRIRPEIPVDIDKFHRILIDKYKTFVGPGHWFERDRRYMRIGYGWPSKDQLIGGLQCIQQAIEESLG